MEKTLSQIEIKESPKAQIRYVRLSLICTECGHTWGVSLLGNYSYPHKWDVCIECSRRKSENIQHELKQIDG